MRSLLAVSMIFLFVACGGNQIVENPYASIPTYTSEEFATDIYSLNFITTETPEVQLVKIQNIRKKYAGYFRLKETNGNLKVITLKPDYVESLEKAQKELEQTLDRQRK